MQWTLQLQPITDLNPFLTEGELVAFNVGPDKFVYVAIAQKPIDYRFKSNECSFAKTIPESPQDYRILAFQHDAVVIDVLITKERFNIHEIQPLPNDEILLVCARSCFSGHNDFDKNGRIYSVDGHFKREILLGDGIQDTQTTSKGLIWTSYFDEGVFGNRGWEVPVGSSGLVAWDSSGNKTYEFQPRYGLDFICDCYALNVVSDSSTWIYYYTDFPLVQLRNQKIEAYWDIPISGSGAFAIFKNFALFRGGYDNKFEYHLFELGTSGKVKEICTIRLIDENEEELKTESVFGRFDSLFILRHDNFVYQLDVRSAVRALK